jgi:hypothetical protein
MDEIEKLKDKRAAQFEQKMNYSLNDIIDDSLKMDDDTFGQSLTSLTEQNKTNQDFYSIETLINLFEIYLKLRSLLYSNIKFI